MKNKKERVYYYRDELNDDFAENNIKTKPLNERYIFTDDSFFGRVGEFVVYRIIAQPLVTAFIKLVWLQRFKNRRVMKELKGGAFIYANHTGGVIDAFIPNFVCYRKHNHIIVGPDAMSIKGLNGLLRMLGAIPIGSSVKQMGQMMECIDRRISEGRLVTIYPEAHIWPYYTRIRPFPAASFRYPCKSGTPVYTMTTCYKKRAVGKLPKAVTCVDGPFFPKDELPIKQRMQALRDECYAAMCRRAEEESDYEYVKYVKLPEEKE